MNIIATPLLFASLFASSLNDGRELQTNALRSQFVKTKIAQAKNLLVKAYENPNSSFQERRLINILWQFLERKEINYPPIGEDYSQVGDTENICKSAMALAYDGEIYLCGSMLDYGLTHNKVLLNILIHEVAHATGVDASYSQDVECGADLTSIMVHRLAGLRSPALDGHYVTSGRCKL